MYMCCRRNPVLRPKYPTESDQCQDDKNLQLFSGRYERENGLLTPDIGEESLEHLDDDFGTLND